jgi:hypothetical protein
MDMVLLKSGIVKELKDRKKYKKLNSKNVAVVMMKCHSDILGDYYNAMSYETYELCRKIEKVKLSYGFLSMTYTNEEECGPWSDALTRYEYRYTDMSNLINKLNEIVISEYCLNDIYWEHSSFYCYSYDEITTKVWMKNKSNPKKCDVGTFLDSLKMQTPLTKIPVLKTKKDKWFAKNKITCKGHTYICLYGCLYVKVEKYLSTIDSIKGHVTSYITDEDVDLDKMSMDELEQFTDETYKVDVDVASPKTLKSLYEVPMVDFIMNEIAEGDGGTCTTKKSFKVKYKDGEKEKIKFRELWQRIFG